MSNRIDEALNNSWIWGVELFPEHEQQSIYRHLRISSMSWRIATKTIRGKRGGRLEITGSSLSKYTLGTKLRRDPSDSVFSLVYDSTQPGTIHLASLPYDVTSDRSHALSFYFTQRITVREIIGYIMQVSRCSATIPS